MVNKYFFIAAFLFWLLPAIVRLCVIDISEIAISHTTTFEINSPANKTLYFLYNKDKHSAFITILKNNMQGCILNVLGGGLLGIGTLFNLFCGCMLPNIQTRHEYNRYFRFNLAP